MTGTDDLREAMSRAHCKKFGHRWRRAGGYYVCTRPACRGDRRAMKPIRSET